jgi:hypothetical protein
MSNLSIWNDGITGETILIGDADCKEGDTVFIVPLTQGSIIAWIRALLAMLDDGDICDVPGEITKCTHAE